MNIEARKRIQEEIANSRILSTQSVSDKPEVNSNGSIIWMGVCVLVLTLCLGWIAWKKGKFDNLIPHEVAVEKSIPKIDNNFQKELNDKEQWAKVTAWATKINKSIKDSNERISLMDQKIWLLGIANNENSQMNYQINKSRGIIANYIVFDEKWKINRMPYIIPLTANEKELLQKHVNLNMLKIK